MSVLSKLVVPAVILTIASATAAAADDNEVLIGAATSFSGWMAAFDTSPTHAAEIAIQDINAADGVLGKKLRLVHIDTKTDAAQTARVTSDPAALRDAMDPRSPRRHPDPIRASMAP